VVPVNEIEVVQDGDSLILGVRDSENVNEAVGDPVFVDVFEVLYDGESEEVLVCV